MLPLLILLSCQTAAPDEVVEPEPTALPAAEADEPDVPFTAEPIVGGPVLLRESIALRQVAEVGGGAIKLTVNPLTNDIFYLRSGEGVFQLIVGDEPQTQKVVDIADITPDGFLTGMKFGPDGALYVVVNRRPDGSETMTQAAVYKGIAANGQFAWHNVATTDPYPASNTNFDHLFNGIAISPDNEWLYVNSGSRTDHGEVQESGGAFPGVREVPLTSAVLRLPTSARDLVLPNDVGGLLEMGALFADGTRNAYDLEFAPNGDLFGIDNGPDADFAEELNWLREGRHYGFPWRFGDQDNPQQFADYDPAADNRLSEDFVAVQTGTYVNDPEFPAAPAQFTDPVINLGPAAAQYRDDEGQPRDAGAEEGSLATFTPHRSPLGLVFVDPDQGPAALRVPDGALSLLLVSWGAAGGDLTDQGQDLLHMVLRKQGDQYEAVTLQLARNFKRPIDAVMIENRLYILEWDGNGIIWELTFN